MITIPNNDPDKTVKQIFAFEETTVDIWFHSIDKIKNEATFYYIASDNNTNIIGEMKLIGDKYIVFRHSGNDEWNKMPVFDDYKSLGDKLLSAMQDVIADHILLD